VFTTISNWIKLHNINSVLDLACGAGLYFPTYNSLGCKVTGIDHSSKRIKIAKKMINIFGYKNINVIEADIFKIQTNVHFDLVVLSYILEHLTECKAKELTIRIKDIADHFIVVGYYSEPFSTILERHRKICKRLDAPFNSLIPSKSLNSVLHDYPKIFNMPYKIRQLNRNVSILMFSKNR